jgi:hypothetical protein
MSIVKKSFGKLADGREADLLSRLARTHAARAAVVVDDAPARTEQRSARETAEEPSSAGS